MNEVLAKLDQESSKNNEQTLVALPPAVAQALGAIWQFQSHHIYLKKTDVTLLPRTATELTKALILLRNHGVIVEDPPVPAPVYNDDDGDFLMGLGAGYILANVHKGR